LLPIGELQEKLFPSTGEVGTHRVKVVTLDSQSPLWRESNRILLKLDVQGFELEVVARPTAALRLAAGLGYVDSTISRDVVGLDATGGSTPGGTRSAGIPKVTGNASVRYDFELAGMPSNVGLNLQHVGEYESGYTPSTRRTLGGYTAMDVRFGVDIGKLTLTAYVNNVTDERPLVTSTPFGSAELVTTMRPRTVGLVGVYRF
jgi:outer membrane receptor protein involved in Fe transport